MALALFVIVLTSASAQSAPPSPPSPPGVKFTVSKQFPLISDGVLQRVGSSPDAALQAIRTSTGEYHFWEGARDWHGISSSGGKLEGTVGRGRVKILGYPCPAGYPTPCLTDSKPKANIGMWISGVHKIDDKGDELLGFVHMEFRHNWVAKGRTGNWNVRHGLTYSNDGGNTFHWCGYIVAPVGPCSKTLTDTCTTANLGLTNIIYKDGFFMSYYQDGDRKCKASDRDCDGQDVAVVRAKVDDVVAAARQHKVTPWFKYYNGGWTEPGLGGNYTRLNIPQQGYMHGDGIFIKPLNQWALVVHSGDKGSDKANWRKTVLITFSSDGITWSDWQKVYTEGGEDDLAYPSLMSYCEYGPDNNVAGTTFAVAFVNRQPHKQPFQFSAVNVTVRIEGDTVVV